MLAWRSHIDGAVDIVKARGGRKMCHTKTGTHLFNAVRHLLVGLSNTLAKLKLTILAIPHIVFWCLRSSEPKLLGR